MEYLTYKDDNYIYKYLDAKYKILEINPKQSSLLLAIISPIVNFRTNTRQ